MVLQMRAAGHDVSVTSSQLTATMASLQTVLVDSFISEDERLIGHQTMQLLAASIVQLNQSRINGTSGGWTYRYGHLSAFSISNGQQVRPQTEIGIVGVKGTA